MPEMDRVPVPGSERQLEPAHARVGDVDPQAQVEVTVYVRPRAAVEFHDDASRPLSERRLVDREEWASAHGASDEDIAAVRAFAEQAGLTVVQADAARRAVVLRGSLERVADAFRARLEGRFAAGDGGREYRARSGPLTVPADLGDVITGVFGIDDRPQARTHIRRAPAAPTAAGTSYTPLQIADAYAFPAGTTGQGETIGILELGGGFDTSDLSTYFAGLGIAPAPSVTAVSVDGATNSPGTDQGADGEVMLDIEVAGAVAPGAAIAVYFAPNTDQGFIDGLSTAVHDTTRHPSVISISWGQSEDGWSAQGRTQMEQILTEAAALGVTVTVAAGDNGSTDGVNDGKQHVDFPASAPHALACGGTSLTLSGAAIGAETVWNDSEGATGGGVSRQFPVPSYQTSAHVPDNADSHAAGRGVPDVAGDADPATGYQVRVDGTDTVVGGTSAVAPLWAGLVARLNQHLGAPIGFAQPRLYPLLGGGAFHDITQGSNGAYQAGAGYDVCTGLGTPDGTALAAALGGSSQS